MAVDFKLQVQQGPDGRMDITLEWPPAFCQPFELMEPADRCQLLREYHGERCKGAQGGVCRCWKDLPASEAQPAPPA